LAETRHDVTDAELAVLEVLWNRGDATIRAIADVLYPGGGVSHYATVQKLLERLEGKRCVGRTRGPGAHVFAATLDRDALIEGRLRDVAERFCDGALAPLLTHFVRGRRLSRQDRIALRSLVEGLDHGAEDGDAEGHR